MDLIKPFLFSRPTRSSRRSATAAPSRSTTWQYKNVAIQFYWEIAQLRSSKENGKYDHFLYLGPQFFSTGEATDQDMLAPDCSSIHLDFSGYLGTLPGYFLLWS